MSLYSINDPKHWLDRAKEARALAEQMAIPKPSAQCSKMPMITSGSPKSRRTSSRSLAKVKVVHSP
jgi:hypothetical protein